MSFLEKLAKKKETKKKNNALRNTLVGVGSALGLGALGLGAYKLLGRKATKKATSALAKGIIHEPGPPAGVSYGDLIPKGVIGTPASKKTVSKATEKATSALAKGIIHEPGPPTGVSYGDLIPGLTVHKAKKVVKKAKPGTLESILQNITFDNNADKRGVSKAVKKIVKKYNPRVISEPHA